VVRKLFASILGIVLMTLLTSPISASSAQGYVKLYNYTECELQVSLNGVVQGNIPVGYSAHWIPASYGLHKVEVSKVSGWTTTYKYAEVSYSYPNAMVTINRYDL